MENPYLMSLAQYAVGLTICQNLILKYLIKKGIINKTEISNALDFLIDDFNKANPVQAITLAIKGIKDGLEKDLPNFPPPPPENQRPKANHPEWLKGIIQGGKK